MEYASEEDQLEAIAQFLRQGTAGRTASRSPKAPPAFYQTENFRLGTGIAMFSAAIILFRNFGDLLV